MMNIKCVFPRNYYTLRKVNVKLGNTLIGKVGHNEIIELSKIESSIKFNIDYHKTKIDIPNTNEDIFMLVYFNFRNYFPFYITDVMFKNSLRVKLVDKNQFEQFNESFYKAIPSELIKFNFTKIYTIIVGIFISCGFVYSPFFVQNQNNSNSEDFAFYVGLASIIGFLAIIFFRKKISEIQYKIRILSFSILSILLLIYLNIGLEIKLFAIALSLSMLMLAMKKRIS
jgi:hypothetical protein